MDEAWFLMSLIIFGPIRHLRTTQGDHIPITCNEALEPISSATPRTISRTQLPCSLPGSKER